MTHFHLPWLSAFDLGVNSNVFQEQTLYALQYDNDSLFAWAKICNSVKYSIHIKQFGKESTTLTDRLLIQPSGHAAS